MNELKSGACIWPVKKKSLDWIACETKFRITFRIWYDYSVIQYFLQKEKNPEKNSEFNSTRKSYHNLYSFLFLLESN